MTTNNQSPQAEPGKMPSSKIPPIEIPPGKVSAGIELLNLMRDHPELFGGVRNPTGTPDTSTQTSNPPSPPQSQIPPPTGSPTLPNKENLTRQQLDNIGDGVFDREGDNLHRPQPQEGQRILAGEDPDTPTVPTTTIDLTKWIGLYEITEPSTGTYHGVKFELTNDPNKVYYYSVDSNGKLQTTAQVTNVVSTSDSRMKLYIPSSTGSLYFDIEFSEKRDLNTGKMSPATFSTPSDASSGAVKDIGGRKVVPGDRELALGLWIASYKITSSQTGDYVNYVLQIPGSQTEIRFGKPESLATVYAVVKGETLTWAANDSSFWSVQFERVWQDSGKVGKNKFSGSVTTGSRTIEVTGEQTLVDDEVFWTDKPWIKSIGAISSIFTVLGFSLWSAYQAKKQDRRLQELDRRIEQGQATQQWNKEAIKSMKEAQEKHAATLAETLTPEAKKKIDSRLTDAAIVERVTKDLKQQITDSIKSGDTRQERFERAPEAVKMEFHTEALNAIRKELKSALESGPGAGPELSTVEKVYSEMRLESIARDMVETLRKDGVVETRIKMELKEKALESKRQQKGKQHGEQTKTLEATRKAQGLHLELTQRRAEGEHRVDHQVGHKGTGGNRAQIVPKGQHGEVLQEKSKEDKSKETVEDPFQEYEKIFLEDPGEIDISKDLQKGNHPEAQKENPFEAAKRLQKENHPEAQKENPFETAKKLQKGNLPEKIEKEQRGDHRAELSGGGHLVGGLWQPYKGVESSGGREKFTVEVHKNFQKHQTVEHRK